MVSLGKLWLVAVVGGLALLCATGPAQAQPAPSLWLGSTDGGATPVITGVGGNPGSVNFNGPLPGSANLLINVTTGISSYNPTGPGTGSLDLNSVNVSVGPHAAAITLYILLSDTNFGPVGAGSLKMSIGGTLDTSGTTSLTAQGVKDPSNTLFGGFTPTVPPGSPKAGSIHVTLGPFTGAGGFSGDKSVGHGPLGTYSLTDEVAITFAASTATQTVSFDQSLNNSVAPEPSTMALAGLGALGFIGYGLRRRRATGV
jgi:PEP-CTERM motif